MLAGKIQAPKRQRHGRGKTADLPGRPVGPGALAQRIPGPVHDPEQFHLPADARINLFELSKNEGTLLLRVHRTDGTRIGTVDPYGDVGHPPAAVQ